MTATVTVTAPYTTPRGTICGSSASMRRALAPVMTGVARRRRGVSEGDGKSVTAFGHSRLLAGERIKAVTQGTILTFCGNTHTI